MEREIVQAYEHARRVYAGFGVDTDEAVERLSGIKISMHCWQGDDQRGFLEERGSGSGGILVTGSHPGAARGPEELRRDLAKALSLIPGRHKVSLHAKYGEAPPGTGFDQLKPEHFAGWVRWARENGVGLDFNPTCYSHPMADSGFTLSSPDPEVRDYWVRHCRACVRIAEYLGEQTGQRCVNNIWVPDGYKDLPFDREAPRRRLRDSLDRIFLDSGPCLHHLDTLESKLFGIGCESCTVGSHEFYLGYALQSGKGLCLDTGHFHPTEKVSDKISAVMLFVQELLVHISRPVRWDSDHVVVLDDELREIACELVRGGLLGRVHLGLDFFDASVNRVAAWVIGMRSAQKALLLALLEPAGLLRGAEEAGDCTARLALLEEEKFLPCQAVWDWFCEKCGVPSGARWLAEAQRYEREVLQKR